MKPRRRTRRDPISRHAMIALGYQALKETYQHGTSEASYVFEDAWREATPLEVHHLADNLHSAAGAFEQRAALYRMLLWLEDAPVREATERAEPRVAKVLSRAWKSKHEDALKKSRHRVDRALWLFSKFTPP